MAIIENRIVGIVVTVAILVGFMAFKPAYSQSNNENSVQGESVTIFPGSIQIAQLGCRYDRDRNTMLVVFADFGNFQVSIDAKNGALDVSDLVKSSCAEALTKLAAAGFNERSATQIGDFQILNLSRFGRILPVPLPPVPVLE